MVASQKPAHASLRFAYVAQQADIGVPDQRRHAEQLCRSATQLHAQSVLPPIDPMQRAGRLAVDVRSITLILIAAGGK